MNESSSTRSKIRRENERTLIIHVLTAKCMSSTGCENVEVTKSSCWRRKPKEGIERVCHRRICSFDCLRRLSIKGCRRSLRATHLLSLTIFLRRGNLERTFLRVRSLGDEFVRTRNSMFISPLV